MIGIYSYCLWCTIGTRCVRRPQGTWIEIDMVRDGYGRRPGQCTLTSCMPWLTQLLLLVCVSEELGNVHVLASCSNFFPLPFGSCLGQNFNTLLVQLYIYLYICAWERCLCLSLSVFLLLFSFLPSHSPKPNLLGMYWLSLMHALLFVTRVFIYSPVYFKS